MADSAWNYTCHSLPPCESPWEKLSELKETEPAYAPWSPGTAVIESALQTQLVTSLLEFKHGHSASFLTPAACLTFHGGFALGLNLPHGMFGSGVIFWSS